MVAEELCDHISAVIRELGGAGVCDFSYRAGGLYRAEETRMNAPMPALQRDSVDRLDALRQIERKLLWLSAWMVHQANHVRPNRDGLKVGGHQQAAPVSFRY